MLPAMKKSAMIAALLSLTACGAEPEQPIVIEALTIDGHVLRLAREAKDFLQSTKKPATNDVAIDFVSIETDRLGNQTKVPSFRLYFSKDDVNAAKLENLNDIAVMQLLTRVEVLSTPSQRVVHHFCDPGFYPAFCNLAKADIMQRAELRAAAAPSEPQSKPAR